MILTNTKTIPYIDLNGSGQIIHFSHANGYPPECYKPLLSKLSKHYHVLSMLQRPLWPGSDPNEIKDWLPLAQDLLSFLEQRFITSSIAIGHSLGGVNSLRAVILAPERFKALILIDPVLFTPRVILARRLIWSLNLVYRFHPYIKATSYRRREFSDLKSVFEGFRKKSVFRYMDDASLQAYVEGITTPKPGGGYKLAFSPEWEMRIYATGIWRDMDIWRNLSKINIPILVIRGSESDTFLPASAKLFLRRQPEAGVITIENSTHLVPLEYPDLVCNAIIQFLQEKL
jgi:pimeloyl-ACP methyl ester carboxylesterase